METALTALIWMAAILLGLWAGWFLVVTFFMYRAQKCMKARQEAIRREWREEKWRWDRSKDVRRTKGHFKLEDE